MVSKPAPSVALREESENILGQLIYAFGQGAAPTRVTRRAIGALRARYLGPIQTSADGWETRAAYVLPLLAQVGRLAALLATQAGRAAISEADFTAARRLVESRTHATAEAEGQLIAGPLCSAIEGETPVVSPGEPRTSELPSFLGLGGESRTTEGSVAATSGPH
jgi:hypothetical protein